MSGDWRWLLERLVTVRIIGIRVSSRWGSGGCDGGGCGGGGGRSSVALLLLVIGVLGCCALAYVVLRS